MSTNAPQIPAGHVDFENTLTPEQAEEFDRMAADQIAKEKLRVMREQHLQRVRDLLAQVNAFSNEVAMSYAKLSFGPMHQTELVPFRDDLRDVKTSLTHAAGRLAMLGSLRF